jgi:sporulation protein YlmC with PRC-barrel domain
MALIWLQLHEHPASPQHEMRQKCVLDSGGNVVGTVANLYVDEDRVGSFAS